MLGRHGGAAVLAMGIAVGAAGVAVGLAANTITSAAGLDICGTSHSLDPGDHGSCSEKIQDLAQPGYTGPVSVTIVISTESTSGGGSPAAAPPVGTEAALDGTPTGLGVVSITDTDTGTSFQLGVVRCFTSAASSASASYPTAAYCRSVSRRQMVAAAVDNATFSDTFVIKWAFPRAAGNAYQGGGASITVTPTFTGIPTVTSTPTSSVSASPTGGSLGASTTTPTPSGSASGAPHGGALAASTPTTGSQLPILLSRVLIVMGLVLVFAGLLVRRRQRYPRLP